MTCDRETSGFQKSTRPVARVSWSFPIRLEDAKSVPIYRKIAQAILGDIQRGRLKPGDALPGTRRLATELGVHRSTVVSAYSELSAEGRVTMRPGGATVVVEPARAEVPRTFSRAPSAAIMRDTAAFEVRPASRGISARPKCAEGMVDLWGGVPDPRLIPATLIGRSLRRAVRSRTVLSYAEDGRGHPRLRAALARMLSTTRALTVGADDVLVTQGTQMALHLAASALVVAGDVIAVESPGYRAAWDVFRRLGARLIPIPVDADGLDVDELRKVVEREGSRLRAVYVTPHHQYPTTVALSISRRERLLELAGESGFAVFEDDYDHEFQYDGPPIQPLAGADVNGSVIYMGSLSKLLAPGLRMGFAVAPRNVLAKLLEVRASTDTHGNLVSEAAVAELFEEGEVTRHARRVRREYQLRRAVLCEALERRLGRLLSYRIPSGGLTLWTHVAPELDVERWCAQAAQEGVLFQTGASSSFDGLPVQFARFGFARSNVQELAMAADRLARAAEKVLEGAN